MTQTGQPITQNFYFTLLPGRAYLKGIELSPSDQRGITQNDLDDAEEDAFDEISSRLSKMFDISNWRIQTPREVRLAAKKISSAIIIEIHFQRAAPKADEETSSLAETLKKEGRQIISDVIRKGEVTTDDDEVQRKRIRASMLPGTGGSFASSFGPDRIDAFRKAHGRGVPRPIRSPIEDLE